MNKLELENKIKETKKDLEDYQAKLEQLTKWSPYKSKEECRNCLAQTIIVCTSLMNTPSSEKLEELQYEVDSIWEVKALELDPKDKPKLETHNDFEKAICDLANIFIDRFELFI